MADITDLNNIQETAITSDNNEQYTPNISGDKIVWMDDRNINADIYMYDLSKTTNPETKITTDIFNQQNPAISGNNIVWEDWRSQVNPDIYLYTSSIPNFKRRYLFSEKRMALGRFGCKRKISSIMLISLLKIN